MSKLRSPFRRDTKGLQVFSWLITLCFGASLGVLSLQVLQRMHDRVIWNPEQGCTKFLEMEFYVGSKGQRTAQQEESKELEIRDASYSVFLYENAYLDFVFRQTDARHYALRLTTSKQMPSGFLRVEEGVCQQFTPIEKARLAPRTWHNVKLQFTGGEVVLWIDGNRQGGVRDDSYTDGYVGFSTGISMVKLDRVELKGTRILPGGGVQPFHVCKGNPYRRTGTEILVVACGMLFFILERGFFTWIAVARKDVHGRLARGLVLPLLSVFLAFCVSILPKLSLLLLSLLMWALSRLTFLYIHLGVRLRSVLPKPGGKARALMILTGIILTAALVLLRGKTIEMKIPQDLEVWEDPAPRKIGPNFPAFQDSKSVQNFLLEFEARMKENSVAEVVFRKRNDKKPEIVREWGEGRFWYAFVLSTVPGFVPGFAKIEDIDRYRKKLPEDFERPLPSSEWFPVKLRVEGDFFICSAGNGNVTDRLIDDGLVSGTIGISLIKGSLEIRNATFTPLPFTLSYPSILYNMMRPEEKKNAKALQTVGPVEGLNWYVKTPYRFENRFLENQTFRDRRFNREKPADTFRVICIGGSSTYGIMLPPEMEADYPHALERLLNRSSRSMNIQVINAGLIGTYSLRSVEYFKEVLLPFQPDLVVVNLSWNDNMIPVAIERGYPSFKEQFTGWQRSRFVAPILYAREWIDYANRGRRFVKRIKTGRDGGFVISPKNLPVYEGNLHALIDIAEQHCIKIAFLLEPSVDVLTVEKGREVLSDFYNVQRKTAARRGIPCIDPMASLRGHRNDDLFYDVVHLTPAGHRLVAESIRDCLVRTWPELFPQ